MATILVFDSQLVGLRYGEGNWSVLAHLARCACEESSSDAPQQFLQQCPLLHQCHLQLVLCLLCYLMESENLQCHRGYLGNSESPNLTLSFGSSVVVGKLLNLSLQPQCASL